MPVRVARPADAQRAGVAMIHQELDGVVAAYVVPALSVAEDVFLGREPHTRYGLLDRKRMLRETKALLERSGVTSTPPRPSSGCAPANSNGWPSPKLCR
ncbi:hypothetical protein ACWEOE_27835 [Amycolatopsis sp. NPDC004368]